MSRPADEPPKTDEEVTARRRKKKFVDNYLGTSSLADTQSAFTSVLITPQKQIEKTQEVLVDVTQVDVEEQERIMKQVKKIEKVKKMSKPNSSPSREKIGDGRTRSQVRPGSKVDIVLKQDQSTSKLTYGVVADLLTNSITHPQGIKVRLNDGKIGRVQAIYK
jgi:uncharacterized repeat protein (TIGR03833 family)